MRYQPFPLSLSIYSSSISHLFQRGHFFAQLIGSFIGLWGRESAEGFSWQFVLRTFSKSDPSAPARNGQCTIQGNDSDRTAKCLWAAAKQHSSGICFHTIPAYLQLSNPEGIEPRTIWPDGLVTICQLFLSGQLIAFCQYWWTFSCRSAVTTASMSTTLHLHVKRSSETFREIHERDCLIPFSPSPSQQLCSAFAVKSLAPG